MSDEIFPKVVSISLEGNFFSLFFFLYSNRFWAEKNLNQSKERKFIIIQRSEKFFDNFSISKVNDCCFFLSLRGNIAFSSSVPVPSESEEIYELCDNLS